LRRRVGTDGNQDCRDCGSTNCVMHGTSFRIGMCRQLQVGLSGLPDRAARAAGARCEFLDARTIRGP
jgi:hypothetical protein